MSCSGLSSQLSLGSLQLLAFILEEASLAEPFLTAILSSFARAVLSVPGHLWALTIFFFAIWCCFQIRMFVWLFSYIYALEIYEPHAINE